MSTETPPPGRGIAQVELMGIATAHARVAALRCMACGERLDLHQPEAGWPARLLGTCPACHAWFLLDLPPGRPRGVMVLLPDHDHFLRALEAGGGAPPRG